jgi:hypothetical protein
MKALAMPTKQILSLLLLTFCWFSSLAFTVAAESPDDPRQQVSLEDRLVTGLRATRPDDVAYCERVAEATRTGALPAKLVDSTYLWAVGRQAKYPLPAFAQALSIQCRRLGINWQ